MAIKALMQADAFFTLLYPEGGLVIESSQMIKEMALDEFTADKVIDVVKDQVMLSAREVLKRIPSLQEATISWLDQYQRGRFEVTLNTSQLDQSVDKLARFGRQVVISLMLVGMIVGSAIATSVIAFLEPDAQYWTFASRLAYLGFVVPMVIAVFILLRLLWRWIRGESAIMD
jgi:hypothetical protein